MLDREMVDHYLSILEAYSPEDALAMEAAYENMAEGDEEEWAELLIELLKDECGIEVDSL